MRKTRRTACHWSLYVFRNCRPRRNRPRSRQFQKVSDEYFDQVYFPNQPTSGTLAGYHQYDSKLEDFSRKPRSMRKSRDLNHFDRSRLAIPAASLDQTTRGDRADGARTRSTRALLTLQTIRPWARRMPTTTPAPAPTQPSRSWSANSRRPTIVSVHSLPARSRCPAFSPRRAQTSRIRHASSPRSPSNSFPASSASSSTMFPRPSPTPTIPALKSEFAQTNAAVIAALNDYLDWLKTDLLPRSNGDFRIGADTFSKKLQYDEMVDLPLRQAARNRLRRHAPEPAALR